MQSENFSNTQQHDSPSNSFLLLYVIFLRPIISMSNYKYYFFYLEIALKDPKDQNIYAFENVSHIPTKKFIEIFDIDIKKDPFLTEGYFLTKKSYRKHKKYIEENLIALNLDVFEYCLRLYASNDFKQIRRKYKTDYRK